ncbi:MAG: ATP-binding protein [Pseudonocardiaceae bacterium]
MNPYVIPGLEATPYAPLCPHLDKDHRRFYVPVDDTEQQFRHFKQTMNSVRWLTERGRLVVVSGEPGCGKTSLINRCAAWLRDELAEVQLKGEIFTLTDSGTPSQPIMLRMEQVVTDLVDNLRDERRGVSPQHIDLLERRIREIEDIEETSDRQIRHLAKVDRVYRNLHDALPEDRIAIVLLPPSADLVDEIKSYADFVRHPRIVFFAETDYVEAVQRTWPTMVTRDRMAPILLKVGQLNARDSWTYTDARQGSYSGDGSFPKVSEDTILRVTRKGAWSIGGLHRVLHGVYEELASQVAAEGSLPLHEVSFERIFEHIAGYFIQSMLSKPGTKS